MFLRPQKNFTIVRQLQNPFITDTFYVRAVIRDSYTDTVIDTLNLIDKGSQRFSKNWQVAADSSGEGRDISIVTSVYTDSGYTTKSENYGDEENTYVIEDKALNGRSGGFGSGGLDSRTVRRIFQEEFAKTQSEIDTNDSSQDSTRLDEILRTINELKTVLKPEKTNLIPVLNSINQVLKAIHQKEVTPITDLSPILQALHEQDQTNNITKEELNAGLNLLNEAIVKEFPKIMIQVLNKSKFKIDKIVPVEVTLQLPKENVQKEKVIPFDINALTL